MFNKYAQLSRLKKNLTNGRLFDIIYIHSDEKNMKAGDLVRNTREVWANPAVDGGPYPAGCVGIVIDVRPGPGHITAYADVLLSVEGEKVWCGNYTQGHFEVIA